MESCAAVLLYNVFYRKHFLQFALFCFISGVSQRTVLRNYLTSSVPGTFRKNLLMMLTETEDAQENRLKKTFKV